MEQYFGATHISRRDGNGTGSRQSRPIPTIFRLFFLIPKSILFKKLKGTDWRNGEILIPVPFTFDFYFYFF